MLEQSAGLSPRALDALAELERRTVAADGGRIKLEWGVLRTRDGKTVNDVLFWDDTDTDRLIGFAGLYAFGGAALEITGMVDPDRRGRGIGNQLLDAALALGRSRGYASALLVVPRSSEVAAALAQRRGGRLDHSEHALLLRDRLPETVTGGLTSVRPAQLSDVPRLRELLVDGFGAVPGDPDDLLARDQDQTLMIDHDGATVGTIRRTLHGQVGGIYGFVIASSHRGQGIGREALNEVSRGLQRDGAATVRLEVEVDNENALRLYTSTGFEPVTTEDYWKIATS